MHGAVECLQEIPALFGEGLQPRAFAGLGRKLSGKDVLEQAAVETLQAFAFPFLANLDL